MPASSARYENKHLGTDRVACRFEFESYHEQWNQATLTRWRPQPRRTSDAYRTRQNFQPTVTFALAKPLTLELGSQLRTLRERSARRAGARPPTP